MFTHICFGFILYLHFRPAPVEAVSKLNEEVRLKRAINAQAPEGRCLAFQLAKGIGGKELQYVCCNNCDKADQSCDGKTYGYETSLTAHYCGRCGRNTVNSLKLSESFSCGGCYGQTRSMRTCQAHYSEVPIGCWLVRACFESECQKKEGYSVDTCFNGHCDADENVDNCPADCCTVTYNKSCTLVDGVCPSQCCGDSTCCESSIRESNAAFSVLKSFAMVIAFIILCFVGEGLRRKLGCYHNNQVHVAN